MKQDWIAKQDWKGAIFDLDGTLLDSNGIWAEIDRIFLGKRGLSVPDDYMAKLASMGFEAAAVYTAERFSLSETPAEILLEWTKMAEEAYRHGVMLKPYAKQALMMLKAKGIKLAVATASKRTLFLPALENNGVLELFDAITTLDEVTRGKGHPDIYWKAAEKLMLSPSECIVFEDIYLGICSAKKGGFYTVAVSDPHAELDRERICTAADQYLISFQELL